MQHSARPPPPPHPPHTSSAKAYSLSSMRVHSLNLRDELPCGVLGPSTHPQAWLNALKSLSPSPYAICYA